MKINLKKNMLKDKPATVWGTTQKVYAKRKPKRRPLNSPYTRFQAVGGACANRGCRHYERAEHPIMLHRCQTCGIMVCAGCCHSRDYVLANPIRYPATTGAVNTTSIRNGDTFEVTWTQQIQLPATRRVTLTICRNCRA